MKKFKIPKNIMYKFLRYRICLPAVLISLTALIAHGKATPTYLDNASFERVSENGTPAQWSADQQVYSTDSSHAYKGKSSLHYHNTNPSTYRLCSQIVHLQFGYLYQLSAWVKKPNGRRRAKLIVEFYDKNGNYLHGTSESSEAVKSKNWVQVKTGKFKLPDDADPKHVKITCYVQHGGTGDAWFDDVKLERSTERLLKKIVLAQPCYRGHIKIDNGPIVIKGELRHHESVRKAMATVSIVDEQGRVVRSVHKILNAGEQFTIEVATKGLNLGTHQLYFSLRSHKDTTPSDIRSWRIDIVSPSAPHPKTYIDEHHRLIVGGKPMMPIGLYAHARSSGHKHAVEDATDLLKGTPFNSLVVYGKATTKAFESAQKNGIFLIPSIRNRKYYKPEYRLEKGIGSGPVVRFANEPSLLAWYISDEAGSHAILRLKQQYQWVKQLDPNHPIYAVTNKQAIVNQFMGTFDVIGRDSYPIPRNPISKVSTDIEAIKSQVGNARPLWEVLQVFNRKNYGSKHGATPSPIELRNMVWQAITHGANGIILYSLYDIQGRIRHGSHIEWHGGNSDRPYKTYWPHVKAIAHQVAVWAPILLSIENSPKIMVKTSKISPWLSYRVQTWHGRTFVFAVNNTRKTQQVTFHASGSLDHVNMWYKAKRRISAGNDNTWRDTFKPLELHIYKLNGTGAALPPPQNIHPPALNSSKSFKK